MRKCLYIVRDSTDIALYTAYAYCMWIKKLLMAIILYKINYNMWMTNLNVLNGGEELIESKLYYSIKKNNENCKD